MNPGSSMRTERKVCVDVVSNNGLSGLTHRINHEHGSVCGRGNRLRSELSLGKFGEKKDDLMAHYRSLRKTHFQAQGRR